MNKPSTSVNTLDKDKSLHSQDISISEIESVQWDQVISGFADLRQEQLAVFIHNRWPKLTTKYCLFQKSLDSDHKDAIAGAAIMIARVPLIGSGVAIIKWGPILRDTDDSKEMRLIYRNCIALLVQRYAVEQNLLLSILPSTFAESRDWQESLLLEVGFSQGKSLSFPDRYYVNLNIDTEAQRQSYTSKWRYHLKKSEQEELIFIHETSAQGLQIFLNLYQKMTERKQFPDYSAIETLPIMMTIEDQNLKPELFLIKQGTETIAGAVIFKTGESAVYLYGATSDEALPLRAGYFMHHQIMKWLSANTPAKWYDLGGNDGFSGLHQFKKGMVGKRGAITQVPAIYTYGHTFKSRAIGRGLFLLKEIKTSLQQRLEKWLSKLATGDLS